jgi:hypothetical protein
VLSANINLLYLDNIVTIRLRDPPVTLAPLVPPLFPLSTFQKCFLELITQLRKNPGEQCGISIISALYTCTVLWVVITLCYSLLTKVSLLAANYSHWPRMPAFGPTGPRAPQLPPVPHPVIEPGPVRATEQSTDARELSVN